MAARDDRYNPTISNERAGTVKVDFLVTMNPNEFQIHRTSKHFLGSYLHMSYFQNNYRLPNQQMPISLIMLIL